jgi:hypothetical protein
VTRSLLAAAFMLIVTGMLLDDSPVGTALVAIGIGTLVVAIVEWGRA